MMCDQQYSVREGLIKEKSVRATLFIGGLVHVFDMSLLGDIEKQVWLEIKGLHEKHGFALDVEMRLEYQVTNSIPIIIESNQPEADQ